MTYPTTNIDLAAALIATGVELMDVRTDDGVIVTFVFPDRYGDTYTLLTEDAAKDFALRTLLVDAYAITQRLRDLRVTIRRAQDTYRKRVRGEAGIQ